LFAWLAQGQRADIPLGAGVAIAARLCVRGVFTRSVQRAVFIRAGVVVLTSLQFSFALPIFAEIIGRAGLVVVAWLSVLNRGHRALARSDAALIVQTGTIIAFWTVNDRDRVDLA